MTISKKMKTGKKSPKDSFRNPMIDLLLYLKKIWQNVCVKWYQPYGFCQNIAKIALFIPIQLESFSGWLKTRLEGDRAEWKYINFRPTFKLCWLSVKTFSLMVLTLKSTGQNTNESL